MELVEIVRKDKSKMYIFEQDHKSNVIYIESSICLLKIYNSSEDDLKFVNNISNQVM